MIRYLNFHIFIRLNADDCIDAFIDNIVCICNNRHIQKATMFREGLPNLEALQDSYMPDTNPDKIQENVRNCVQHLWKIRGTDHGKQTNSITHTIRP